MIEHMNNKSIKETVNHKSYINVGCDKADINSHYCIVKVLHSSETQPCRMKIPDQVKKGDFIIINSRYGKDLAVVTGSTKCVCKFEKDSIETIIRVANKRDHYNYKKNLNREKEALRLCKLKVIEHKLSMKLIYAHYLLEGSKLLFFFTAEFRVDFRELVKNLVSIFKVRIELRQIGVRDESRVLGGLAVCGRTYCCHGVSDKLKPVSIRIAKEQNLSLNSKKILGPCGRLMCCLSYEHDFYKEEKPKYPFKGNKILSGDEFFKVLDVNIITRKITVASIDGRIFTVPNEYFTMNDSGKWTILESYFSL